MQTTWLRILLGCAWFVAVVGAVTPLPAQAQNPFLSQQGDRTVASLRFHGQTITKEYVLRRTAMVQVGDEYSSSLIPEIRERLDALPFIAYVDIEARPAGPGKMALDIEITEDTRFRWSSGIRYERRHDGWIADLAVGMVNLTGRAETLALQGSLWNERRLGLVFQNPHILGDVDVGVELGAQVVEHDWRYDDFEFRAWGGHASVWRDFVAELRLRADLEFREIKAFNGDLALEIEPQRFGGFVGDETSVRLSLVHDSRDQRFYPFRGLYLEAAGTVANSATGRDYALGEFDARAFYPVRKLVTVAARARLRVADSRLPFYERSYLGGPMSLRGIEFGTIRGDHDYLASIELRRPIFVLPLRDGKAVGLGIHAFHDWGQATEHGLSPFDVSPRWDYGAGAHFNFGTRNFRFEWARTDAEETVFVFEDRFTF